jgi:hypothetical protein
MNFLCEALKGLPGGSSHVGELVLKVDRRSLHCPDEEWLVT